jgi:hypothetical protein
MPVAGFEECLRMDRGVAKDPVMAVESFEHRLGDVKADLRRQQFGEVIHVDRAFVPCREDTRDCIVRVGLRRIAPLGPRLLALWALAGVGPLSGYLRSLRRFIRVHRCNTRQKISALLCFALLYFTSPRVTRRTLLSSCARRAQPERA